MTIFCELSLDWSQSGKREPGEMARGKLAVICELDGPGLGWALPLIISNTRIRGRDSLVEVGEGCQFATGQRQLNEKLFHPRRMARGSN